MMKFAPLSPLYVDVVSCRTCQEPIGQSESCPVCTYRQLVRSTFTVLYCLSIGHNLFESFLIQAYFLPTWVRGQGPYITSDVIGLLRDSLFNNENLSSVILILSSDRTLCPLDTILCRNLIISTNYTRKPASIVK